MDNNVSRTETITVEINIDSLNSLQCSIENCGGINLHGKIPHCRYFVKKGRAKTMEPLRRNPIDPNYILRCKQCLETVE